MMSHFAGVRSEPSNENDKEETERKDGRRQGTVGWKQVLKELQDNKITSSSEEASLTPLISSRLLDRVSHRLNSIFGR